MTTIKSGDRRFVAEHVTFFRGEVNEAAVWAKALLTMRATTIAALGKDGKDAIDAFLLASLPTKLQGAALSWCLSKADGVTLVNFDDDESSSRR